MSLSPFTELVQQVEQAIRHRQLKRLFVTGTDTDVGKTTIGAQLLQQLQQQAPNLHITARKPIASGCHKTSQNGELSCADSEQLYQALNGKTPLEIITPYRLEPPIAPTLALKNAGQTLTTEALYQACIKKTEKVDFVLIEGAGGFYSPLSSHDTNAPLAKKLKSPVLLVVKAQLGCVNHTLLTADAIRHQGLDLFAIVLNFAQPNNQNGELIQQFLPDIPLYWVPERLSFA
ncbi:dethiobiotin synthase [Galenea microaerophila]